MREQESVGANPYVFLSGLNISQTILRRREDWARFYFILSYQYQCLVIIDVKVKCSSHISCRTGDQNGDKSLELLQSRWVQVCSNKQVGLSVYHMKKQMGPLYRRLSCTSTLPLR
jgi:hypothetical protein